MHYMLMAMPFIEIAIIACVATSFNPHFHRWLMHGEQLMS